MGELGPIVPGTQAELPRDTVVYDLSFGQDGAAWASITDELHRTQHRTVVLVIACAPTIELARYCMCLVPTEVGTLLGWVYDRNVRAYA